MRTLRIRIPTYKFSIQHTHSTPSKNSVNDPEELPLKYFFLISVYVFIFGCAWVFIAVCGLSLTAMSRGDSLVGVLRLLTVVVSLVVEHRLWAHKLSCSVACGILTDQGSNLCRLHWQEDHQEPSL